NVSPQTSQAPQRPPPPQQQQRPPMQGAPAGYPSQDSLREEQRRKQLEAQQRQRRELEERERREQAEYNASLPKTKQSTANQELGGFGGGSPEPSRFNPTRPAPSAPAKGPSQQPPNGLRPQRPAPPVPASSGSRAPGSPMGSSAQQPRPSPGQNSPSRYPAAGAASAPRQPNTGASPAPQASRLPAPVKPLNVAPKPSAAQQQADSVKAAEAALTAKPTATEKKQEARPMSTMSESEVMARLKEVVSKDDPNLSYSKQKKIGQGASGSVYVAKIKEGAQSGVAREVIRQYGPRAQVAIKQMDLAHQPRKELIVNEIMVMRDSRHRNIVNFLDAFLRNNNSELWVVMEFMEGGALTDIIDNNTTITEDQISTICLEVCSPWFANCVTHGANILIDLPRSPPPSLPEDYPPRHQVRQRSPGCSRECQD
ncbi:protein kinase, partial [Candidatus Bathyarchaeota archaeon]|nr:protein kinase [Candidatus Bathyarchaeota archaeon]